MKNKLVILVLLLNLYACEDSVKYAYPKVEFENYTKCEEYDIAPNSEYDEYCKCAEENQLTYPTKHVQHARLIINNAELGKPFQYSDKKYPLDKLFIEEFRKIVSDSSNFRWGELGTQQTCYIIEFLDDSDNLINRANITCGGMVSLEPSLGVTKWGLLNHKANSMLFSLISRYN